MKIKPPVFQSVDDFEFFIDYHDRLYIMGMVKRCGVEFKSFSCRRRPSNGGCPLLYTIFPYLYLVRISSRICFWISIFLTLSMIRRRLSF